MKFKELNEKATSVAQQRLMALALQHKRGELPADKVSPAVKDLAKGMSEKELEDFAKTKHKGLPQKKEDNEVSNRSAALKPQMYNDPNTGKKKVRMVPAKTNIVKTNDRADENYTDPQDASYREPPVKSLAALKKRRAVEKGKKRTNPLRGTKPLKFESVEEAYTGKEVKMAMGIAADPRYKQGNYSAAVRKIERIAKGLSKHPSVAAYLKRMNEAKDPNEYDNEGEMAKTQLKTIVRNAEEMMDLLDDEENMPEWVQSKITKASDYMTSAYNYMASEDEDEDEEDDEKKVDEVVGAVKRIAQGVRDRFGPKKSPVNDKIKQRDQARKTSMARITQRRKEAEKRVRQGYKASQQK